MKILHFATGFPLSYPGGITNYVRSIAAAQVKSGHDAHVLAGPGTDMAVVQQGVSVHDFTSSQLKPFTYNIIFNDTASSQLVKWISKQDFDILHYNMGLDLDMSFYEFIASCGIPYVVSIHDYFLLCPRITMVDFTGRNVCSKVNLKYCCKCIGFIDQKEIVLRIFRRINRMLPDVLNINPPRIKSDRVYFRANVMEQFLEKAHKVLSVSTRVKEIVEMTFPKVSCLVEHIGSNSAHNTNRIKNPSARIRVVFIGMLNFFKGAEVFLAIIKRISRMDMEFHFYGRTDIHYESLLKKHGLVCHGSYKPEDLPYIMANADIGIVLPVWEDNAPQVVMEFLNYGTPVLASRRGGIPDFVNETNGMLFDPSTTEGIEKAVRWLENISLEEIRHMSTRIKQLTTPEQHQERLLNIYSQIVNK